MQYFPNIAMVLCLQHFVGANSFILWKIHVWKVLFTVNIKCFVSTSAVQIKISLHYVATCYQFGNNLEYLPCILWLLILSGELSNLINCLDEPKLICNKTLSARNKESCSSVSMWWHEFFKTRAEDRWHCMSCSFAAGVSWSIACEMI